LDNAGKKKIYMTGYTYLNKLINDRKEVFWMRDG